MTSAQTLIIKSLLVFGISFATVVVLLIQWRLRARQTEFPLLNKLTAGFLVLFAVLAVWVYFDLGQFRYGRYVNPHDLSHYYLNSKYWREIGYLNLYKCILVADAEGNRVFPEHDTIRRQDNYKFVKASRVLAEAREIKKPFSDARWDEFKKDVFFFQSMMPAQKWCAILKDKGYNATPIWNMVARRLTTWFGTSSWYEMSFLVGLDIVLMAAMFLVIYAAFGWRGVLVAVIFFGVNFFMSYRTIKGGLLRLDWVAMLAMAACMLKMNKPKAAGAMAACAAASRIFPVIFVFGFGARCLWEIIETRTIPRKYVNFFAMFFVVLALLIGLSIMDDGGIDRWREYGEKITLHDSHLSGMRMGFKYVFLGTTHIVGPWSKYEAAKVQQLHDRRVLWWAIQGVVLLVCFMASRRLTDYEAFCLSFVPMYFLTAPTWYYYVVLIVPLLFFIGRMERASGILGIIAMFCLSLCGYMLNAIYGMDLLFGFLISIALMAYCLFMLGVGFMEWRRPSTGTEPAYAMNVPAPVLVAVVFLIVGWSFFGAVAATTAV